MNYELRIMKTIIYSMLFSLGLLLLSCNDYLDIPTEGSFSAGGMDYTKIENMFLPVSNAYASLRSNTAHGFAYLGMFEITSDDADKGSTPEDSPLMIELDNFRYGPTNSLTTEFWEGTYGIVSAANNAIVTLPNFEPAFHSDDDWKSYRGMVAESKFLRAYAYFNLVRAYGGVPIIDAVMTSEQLAQLKRATTEEVYAFIQKDLDAGINDLPDYYTKDWAGRVTKYSAMALKAKVFLYQNKMDSVLKYTNMVIDYADRTGQYGLYPNFYRLFRVEQENCEESLFEVQSSTLGRQTGDATYCEYAFYQGPRGNSPGNMQGWGFKVPSQKLIDFLNARGETDRIKATIMVRGTKTDEGDSIKSSCANPFYNMKVYTTSAQNLWNYNGYGFEHNVRLLRFADALLMNAEAKATLGGDAATPLNRVRARVHLDPIPSPTLQDVYDERRAEFAMEENRFFDLVRTGRAPQVLGPLGFVAGKNEVFPIPQKQIQLNPNLTQNNNY